MNKFITAVIVMLVFCNIFCYYTFFREKPSKSQNIRAEYLHYMHRQSLQIEHKHEGQVFPSQVSYGADTAMISLSKIIRKPTLVFYFSQDACPPCLEAVRDSIGKKIPDYQERDDVLFMSNDLELRLYNKYLGKKIIRVYDEKNELFSNTQHFPLFFVIDSDMKIRHLFATDKMTPDLTSVYLDIIKQRYFDK